MKKRRFKILSVVLVMCMTIFQLTCMFALAMGDSPTISVSTASGIVGDKEVKININLADNPGLVSMTLSIEFDQTVLKLVDVEDGGILGSNFHTPARTSPYTLSWVNDTIAENITADGTIAILTFDILDDAKVGKSPLNITYEYGNYGAYNVDMEEIFFQLENGYVDVSESSCVHVFGEYKKNNDATCTNDGTKTAQCTLCGKSNTIIDTGSALGHTFEKKIANSDTLRSKATTTEKATYWCSCVRCDEIGNSEYFEYGDILKIGWISEENSWYYNDSNGNHVTGWAQVSGKWYYFNNSGVMVTGWAQVSGKWYYFNASGAMVTGWVQVGGKWYYMNSSGAMVTGTQRINGKTYRFNTSGVWVA